MDKIKYTAKLVESYALELIKEIDKRGEYQIKVEDYFYIVDDLLSALSEFSTIFKPEHSYEAKKRYIELLLYQANLGFQTKVEGFKDISIDLNKLTIL